MILQPAINVGLLESDFWNMTLAEVERYIEGATWRLKTRAQFDYQLADLIGISMARVYSSEAQLPDIEDVYPNLFDKKPEEKIETDTMVVSQNRFLAFAQAHNARKQKELNTNE